MKITLASGPDYDGLYVDGKLVGQYHWMSASDFIDAISHLIDAEEVEVDDDWYDENKLNFPKNLSDVILKD